jgi:hypothetical protein
LKNTHVVNLLGLLDSRPWFAIRVPPDFEHCSYPESKTTKVRSKDTHEVD